MSWDIIVNVVYLINQRALLYVWWIALYIIDIFRTVDVVSLFKIYGVCQNWSTKINAKVCYSKMYSPHAALWEWFTNIDSFWLVRSSSCLWMQAVHTMQLEMYRNFPQSLYESKALLNFYAQAFLSVSSSVSCISLRSARSLSHTHTHCLFSLPVMLWYAALFQTLNWLNWTWAWASFASCSNRTIRTILPL